MKEIIKIPKFGWLRNSVEKHPWRVLSKVIALAFLIKLAALFFSEPLLFADSYEYIRYAENIRNFSFVAPEAFRTPGYPLFIALAQLLFGTSLFSVIILQILTGTVSLIIIAKILLKLGNNLSAILTVFLLSLSQISFLDLAILSESLAILFVALTIDSMLSYLGNKNLGCLIYSLFSSSLLVLIRPQYFLVILGVGLILAFYRKEKLGIYLIVFIFLIGISWSLVNKKYNAFFGVSSTLGFNLINHVGEYIEKGGEIDPELINIYLKYREIRQSKNQPLEFTIWDSLSEMEETLHLNRSQISKRLLKISTVLIVQHPRLYLKSLHYASLKMIRYTNAYLSEKLKWFAIPSFVMMMIYVVGIYFLIFSFFGNSQNYFILQLFFLFNAVASILLDVGENFRHMIPVLFIPVYFFFAYSSNYFSIQMKQKQQVKR